MLRESGIRKRPGVDGGDRQHEERQPGTKQARGARTKGDTDRNGKYADRTGYSVWVNTTIGTNVGLRRLRSDEIPLARTSHRPPLSTFRPDLDP